MKTKKKKQSVKPDVCKSAPMLRHEYAIIKGSGKKAGTSMWKCKYCPKKIRSS